MKIWVATGNAGKLAEIIPLIHENLNAKAVVEGRAPRDVEENASTFLENARIKAQALRRELESEGIDEFCILADDSGLEVDALQGAPGVHSARYAGPKADAQENLSKLLQALSSVPPSERSARYRCSLVLYLKRLNRRDVFEFVGEGSCEGQIIDQAQGSSGFGYDPVFFVPEWGKTFAQVSYDEKNQASHRRRAFQALQKAAAGFLD